MLLDLRKYQLDRVELGHVGHVPDVVNVVFRVDCSNVLMKVHSEVVKYDRKWLSFVPCKQSFYKLCKTLVVRCLI